MIEGQLRKNITGRWQLNECELTSGSCLEIKMGGKWISGCIEYLRCDADYFFYTDNEGHPIRLYNNILARIVT